MCILKFNPKLFIFQCYSEVPLQHPVEESARHHQCKTGGLSNTVFNGPPVTSSITSFVKLPAASLKLVFEDAMENPVRIVHVVYFIGISHSFIYGKLFILLSRLTIVSREAKKKQRPLSELFTWTTAKKLGNAQAKPP